jgi:hypothetical protein
LRGWLASALAGFFGMFLGARLVDGSLGGQQGRVPVPPVPRLMLR